MIILKECFNQSMTKEKNKLWQTIELKAQQNDRKPI